MGERKKGKRYQAERGRGKLEGVPELGNSSAEVRKRGRGKAK